MGQINGSIRTIVTAEAQPKEDMWRHIGMRLNAVLDFNELLDLLFDQIALVMPDDGVEIIFVLDGNTRVMRQRQSPSSPTIRNDITDPNIHTFPLNKTRNQQQIVRTGKPLIIPDTHQYEGWVHQKHIPSTFHSWAGVPLFTDNQVQAILAVYSKKINAYHADDMEQLLLFAKQAELAIQNRMLYQSTKRQLDELRTLQTLTALAVAATDENELISEVMPIIKKTIPADNLGILMVNKEKTKLIVRAAYHAGEHNPNFSAIPIDTGITGHVFRTGDTVCAKDVSQSPHYVTVESRTRSALCVPLRGESVSLGVINAESNLSHAYSTDDEQSLLTIANQIATAVSKIRLLAREKQRQQEAKTLRLAGNALVASLSLNDVLENIMSEMEKLIHFDSAGVMLLEGDYVRVVAGRGFPPDIYKTLIGQRFPSGELFAVNPDNYYAPIIIGDMRNESAFSFWGGTTYIRSWIGAPLVARGKIIGFLTVDNRRINAYGEQQKQIMQAFANQAAIAIENARLFEAEQKERKTAVILQKAATRLSESRDLYTVLNQLLDFLAELVPYDSANITLLENKSLVHKALRGYEKWTNAVEMWGLRFNVEKNNAFATLFKMGKSYIINDTSTASDWQKTPTNGHVYSWLGVPLYTGGSIIGCISVDKNKVGFFTQEHTRLVERLAAQTAVAIQNTLLYSEMYNVGMLQRILNATPHIINALLDLVPLIKSAANCQFVSLSIFDDNKKNAYVCYTVTNDPPAIDKQYLKLENSIVSTESLYKIVYQPDLSLITEYDIEHARYNKGMRSRILLPLIAGDTVIGYLDLSWDKKDGYDIKRLSLFKRIANAIALAVERGELYDQSQRQASELAILLALSTAMREATAVPDILNSLTQYAEELLQPLCVFILLTEKSTNTLVAYNTKEQEETRQCHPILNNIGISGHVLATGKPYATKKLIDDVLINTSIKKYPELADIGGSITVPLRAQERTIGIVHIGLRLEHVPSEIEINLLMGIADIAGSALDRAQVLETLEQRVDERTHELTVANQRLMELDKLKSKFVSDISHELRTPITNLGLYMELMERGNADKQARYLKILHSQSDRLRNLVEDILSISRLERLGGEMDLTAVNANNLINKIVQSRSVQAKITDLTLTLTLQPTLPTVLSDNVYLSEIIHNLLTNALNYTDEGEISISTAVDEDMILITIADTGRGIDEEDAPHIFDRFYRGHAVGSSTISGTGLGLSIVQEVVRLHNGRLDIDSTVNKGTTVRVWLPKAP